MAKFTKEQILQLFNEYKKDHPNINIKFLDKDKITLSWEGKKSVRVGNLNSIGNYFLSKKQPIKQSSSQKDIFKLDNLIKPINKQWKCVSCSITKEEYEQLKKIANVNKIKLNQLIRTVLIRVIESNK